MAHEGYLSYDGNEFANASRTVQLARTLGIGTISLPHKKVDWIDTMVGGSDYANIVNAPWYDPNVPASQEFAGLLVLRVDGLDDSTMQASPVEYITDGGHPGTPRNTTQALVFDGRLIASTERGAEFGKRWIARLLSKRSTGVFCAGSDLHYFRIGSVSGNEKVHRRDTRLSRGISVTRKTKRNCSAIWAITFTMTAGDPFEYGEEVVKITSLGADTGATGPGVQASGQLTGKYATCPPSDYTPLYDPQYPAMVAPPTVPEFYPAGWDLTEGQPFKRYWARISILEPDDLRSVPVLKLRSPEEARMVRVSVLPSDAATDEQCDVIWSAIVTYLPANQDFYIDAEAKAVYIHDGYSDFVRRSDSVVYGPDAEPLRWDDISDPLNLVVALDIFTVPGVYNTIMQVTNTFESSAEGYSGTNSTYARDTTAANIQSGTGALKVTATAAGDVTGFPGSASWRAVTPGKRYSVKVNAKSGANVKNFFSRIEWLDANNAVVGSASATAIGSSTTAYTESVVYAIAPANAVKARAAFTIQAAAAAGVHYLDNVSLNEEQDTWQGNGNVRASLNLVAKSD